MNAGEILARLGEGTVLEGPHWPEPVWVLNYALLDLKTPDRPADVPTTMRQLATDEDGIINWSLEAVTPEYFAEINARRSREVRPPLSPVPDRRVSQEDGQVRPATQAASRRKRPKRLSIQGNRKQEEDRRAILTQRLKERLAEIYQERHLSEKPPEALGVAVILPPSKEVVAAVEGMESDPEVERIAVEFVKRFETEHGRKPVSVEKENCGWEITSLLGGQVARYIEVKGRAGIGGVVLTPNEWIKAQRFGNDYWLYIVVNCRDKPTLQLVRNPAATLSPKEEISVVRYVVGVQEWRRAASVNADTRRQA